MATLAVICDIFGRAIEGVSCLVAASQLIPTTKTILDQPSASIIAALITAFFGSWLGAYLALTRFKKERAFEKQLAWYEQMIKALHHLAERIEIASTFQEDTTASNRLLERVWRQVQGAHVDLEALISEATLYGSTDAAKTCDRVSKFVQDVANDSEAFDLPKHPEVVSKLPLIDELPRKLRRAAKPLAEEARRHLGIK